MALKLHFVAPRASLGGTCEHEGAQIVLSPRRDACFQCRRASRAGESPFWPLGDIEKVTKNHFKRRSKKGHKKVSLFERVDLQKPILITNGKRVYVFDAMLCVLSVLGVLDVLSVLEVLRVLSALSVLDVRCVLGVLRVLCALSVNPVFPA